MAEGIINKLTPLELIFYYINFSDKYSYSFNNSLANREKNLKLGNGLIKLMSLLGIIFLFYIWNLPVYEYKIFPKGTQVNETFLLGPLTNNEDCFKLKTDIVSNNKDNLHILIISNDLKSTFICRDSIVNLLKKDFNDNNMDYPPLELYFSYKQLPKENLVRYFSAFLLFLLGFFYSKKINSFF
jgi:hypothetical protein